MYGGVGVVMHGLHALGRTSTQRPVYAERVRQYGPDLFTVHQLTLKDSTPRLPWQLKIALAETTVLHLCRFPFVPFPHAVAANLSHQ